MKKKLASLALVLLVLAGCSDWERTTFQTLSASQAVINQAQTDYEARTIPHTTATFNVINEAKAVQTTAVQSMVTYENVKAAKGTATALSAQQQIVATALTQLPPLIASIKALYSTTKTVTGGGN